MNFLTERIRTFHEKKLHDATQKLLSHQNRKKQLEDDLKRSNDELKIAIKDEIDRQNDFVDIWKKNIAKINEEIAKLKN